MKRRLFWIFPAVALVFALSIYLSRKKLDEIQATSNQRVVVIDTPTPEPTPQATPSDVAAKGAENYANLGPSETSGCVIQDEFKKIKADLGKIVNSDLVQHNTSGFSQKVNEFRTKNGIPVPVSVGLDKLNQENVVHNNCRSTCHGSVHEVFVSQIVKGRSIEVLLKDGSLKKLPLHESGLEVASVDELNKKGVPFRSWLAPVSENDWYIQGNDLYYSLDISGLWLRIGTSSQWEVVSTPADLLKLKVVDEPLKIPGCNADEQCLESGTRHFKAPRICKGQ